jgi:predicted membrane channel-forming protein YqfA (hemolysin III family)
MNLITALCVNAAFTALCSAICLGSTDLVAAHISAPDRLWILALGAMLLTYVPILLFAAAQPRPWLVKTIIVLDWAFVAISTIYIILQWEKMAGLGLALFILVALLVAMFAIFQRRGLAAAAREVRI